MKKTSKLNELNTQIGNRGYTILKEEAPSSVLSDVRKHLTVQPFVNSSYTQNVPSFAIYMESQRKLYLPRYFGTEMFGEPKNISIQKGEPMNEDVVFKGKLKPVQEPIVSEYLKVTQDKQYGGGIISVPCGYGKCLAKGTKVLLYAGGYKKVENINPGDVLMGDDSTPRNVLTTCKGMEYMYNITTSNQLSYKVNQSHILSLVKNANTKNEIVCDMSIKNYLELDETERKQWKGYQVAVHYKKQKLGFFTKKPFEYITNDHSPYERIPDIYLYNSFKVRLCLLGGIIYKYSQNKIIFNDSYRLFFGKNNIIYKDVLFLLNSLGLKYSVNENINFKIVRIYKNPLVPIPLSLESIKTLHNDMFQNFGKIPHDINLEMDTIDNYYGFTLDGNHRFMLHNCIVTHNTVLAINIASLLKTKTLVVVHKEFLMNQWKERIEQFLPSARVGRIQSNIIDTEDKDIVLGMLQSISMIDYPKETFQGFGMVIYDECHHLGAEVFSRSLLKTACPYTLGLSATPKRQDGLTKVFHWYLGPTIYQIKKRADKNVDVRLYHFEDNHTDYSKEVVNFLGKPNMAQMINNITSFTPRIQLVFDILLPLLNEGRKILVLSDRKNHLGELKKTIENYAFTHDDFKYTAGYYLGGMKACDLEKTEKDNIILGTFSMASEGFDCREPLDTIVLASPKSTIEQAVGRILRQDEKDRKFVPLVIDIVDEFATFPRQALKRVKFYKSNGYKITTFNKNQEPIPNRYVKTKQKTQKNEELHFLADSD